jgi:hypothetical protein
MRKRNGMLDKSCASKNTNVLECWFDSSHAYICRKENYLTSSTFQRWYIHARQLYFLGHCIACKISIWRPNKFLSSWKSKKTTLISFISAGTLAMLRREQNDTNTKIAATLVCNFKGIKMICIMSISRKLLVCINEDLNYMRYTS